MLLIFFVFFVCVCGGVKMLATIIVSFRVLDDYQKNVFLLILEYFLIFSYFSLCLTKLVFCPFLAFCFGYVRF